MSAETQTLTFFGEIKIIRASIYSDLTIIVIACYFFKGDF